jgi:hypothetical protein
MFLTFAVFQLFMLFVYKSKLPFFEQYRVAPNVAHLLPRNPGLGSKTPKNGPPLSSDL